MLISWLLKYDGYPPGVVAALLLHGILMYIFLPKEFEPAEQVSIEPASFVVASAARQSPQKLRRLEQQTQQRNREAERERQRQADQQRQREADQERQRVAEQQRQREADQERQRVADEQRQREAEQQRQREQEQERQRAAERQQQVAAQQAADEAARRQAADNAAQQLSAENQMVSQYMTIIRDLVSGAWSRPPDARNGMVAIVQLRLTPTGEIVSSDIVQSSGSLAFDRSVLQAVDRVGSFSELQDMPTAVFERNFRNFNLEFSPEDLLR